MTEKQNIAFNMIRQSMEYIGTSDQQIIEELFSLTDEELEDFIENK